MNREIKERTKWFMDARFGMFIHWGLYSIPACGEWVMSQKEMTIEEYRKYFEQFDPVDYNPKTWVRLAKEAGMKYVVLTAKHHDGFCLFDSKLTDYKATNTKAGRDLVREFVDACREEGLKVGLYFSIIDWHHPDFPKYRFPNLRTGIMAGSPCPIKVMQDVIEKMHMPEICITYGQTEASPGCTMSKTTDSIEDRVNTVGGAMFGVECKDRRPRNRQGAARQYRRRICRKRI